MPLQERLLGEDGNPRKTKDTEDPFRMGLVLEWVYGTIVSTAEKARDSAKKPLGKLCSLPGLRPLAHSCIGAAGSKAHASRTHWKEEMRAPFVVRRPAAALP